jgi:glutamate-5-semialdehyde dehydrogenase
MPSPSVAERSSMTLETLTEGQPIVYGGNRITHVGAALAAAFRSGDHLVVVQSTGDLLHVPSAEHDAARLAVDDAVDAFDALSRCDDDQITEFFEHFAARLETEGSIGPILSANAKDVAAAAAAGRSTTRLALTPAMRAGMVDGLRGWRAAPAGRDRAVETIEHPGWSLEIRRAPLGVVGFVFEGRPNVFADATGVLRTGNTVVFRIGSDALGTALAISEHALAPALAAAGLPPGAVRLVPSAARAAGWALFSDPRLALAVARGSGPAVAQLGAVARQTGTPVSLHGTGGAWLVAGLAADAERLRRAVVHSLDRKVCNTLNVCCVPAARAGELVPVLLDALDEAAARRGTSARVHVEEGSVAAVPADRFGRTVLVRRADGDHEEPAATTIERVALATEWEWEVSPEVSLVVTADVDEAVALANRFSPRFVASLISDDAAEQARFYDAVDAPFVGDGFTRWVDGQYALGTPELGLSNWQGGRMPARGAILSGDGVFSVRYRASISDPDLRR